MAVASAKPEPARKLTRTDWAQAALVAIGEGGLGAVAVEPLAAQLGVTKGSFYWHFANRAALINAALERWERMHTDAVIRLVDAQPDPRARLERLLRLVVGVTPEDHIEMSLLASADDPHVAPVLDRVTEQRIAYVSSLYEQLGHPRAEARRRGVLAVSAYLGHLQLARAAPGALPQSETEWRRHLDTMVATLLGAPDE
jgi:AcrR family transcriptional regulator